MYTLFKFDGHRSYGSQDVNSKKAEFTASIHHIEQILKIRNFEVPEKLLKRRRRQKKVHCKALCSSTKDNNLLFDKKLIKTSLNMVIENV